jgi:hypothetical protein
MLMCPHRLHTCCGVDGLAGPRAFVLVQTPPCAAGRRTAGASGRMPPHSVPEAGALQCRCLRPPWRWRTCATCGCAPRRWTPQPPGGSSGGPVPAPPSSCSCRTVSVEARLDHLLSPPSAPTRHLHAALGCQVAAGCPWNAAPTAGDNNGVCHWLGRNCGTAPWVNPHAAGRLTVRASSPACRSTDPKVPPSPSMSACAWLALWQAACSCT